MCSLPLCGVELTNVFMLFMPHRDCHEDGLTTQENHRICFCAQVLVHDTTEAQFVSACRCAGLYCCVVIVQENVFAAENVLFYLGSVK